MYNDMELKEHDRVSLNQFVKYLSKTDNIGTIKELSRYSITALLTRIDTATKSDGTPYSESWKSRIEYSLKAYFTSLGRPTTTLSKQANKRKDNIIRGKSDNLQSKKERENYMTYDELSGLMSKYERYNTVDDMKAYLLLASIVYQPPIRPAVYATSRIIHDESELNDTDNFIVMKQRSGYFYINNDKISKHTDDKIIKLSKDYHKVIKESLEYFPREYLFEYKTNDVHKKAMYLLNKLQTITKNNYTFFMARQSYINHFYDSNPNASLNEKKVLARMMRHSYDTAMIYYKKVKVNVSPAPSNISTEIPEEKKRTIKKVKAKPIAVTLTQSQFNKLRRDAIRTANQRRSKDLNTKMKGSTMKKYNIRINKKTGLYE